MTLPIPALIAARNFIPVDRLMLLDTAGAIIWRHDVMPEAQHNLFVPMWRIREIVDLGRMP